MKILISNSSQSNIENITNFSLNISTNYANKIISKIYSTKDNPYIGRYVPEILDNHYRERFCGYYRIIYVVSKKHNTIFIRYIISENKILIYFFKIVKQKSLIL